MNTLTETALAHPDLADFLRHLSRTELYRSWIPRKPVTVLAPTNSALEALGHHGWRTDEREWFVLRHALPGRLTFRQICAKSRLITLSGDLLTVPSDASFRFAVRPVVEDLMTEGVMLHGIDVVFCRVEDIPSRVASSQDASAVLDQIRIGYRFSTCFTTADGTQTPQSRLLLPMEVETMFLDPFQRWVVGE